MNRIASSARLFGKIALLRRRILFQQATSRAVAGGIGVVSLLIGIALLNVALYLYLRDQFGEQISMLIIAGIHLGLAAIGLVVAFRDHHTPALDALAEAEAAAMEMLGDETADITHAVTALSNRVQGIGGNLSIALAALSGLRALTRRKVKAASSS